MFEKIKEYFEMRKLYKDSKKVLVIKGAVAISNIMDVTEILKSMVMKYENSIGDISSDDISKIIQLADTMNNGETRIEVVKSIVDGIQKGRE